MKKNRFEYKTIKIEKTKFVNGDLTLNDVLNEQGRDGWELNQVASIGTFKEIIFMRLINTELKK